MNFWTEPRSGFSIGRCYFREPILISIFYARQDYRLAMHKASSSARQAFGGCLLEPEAGPGDPMGLDAESRSFQDRPSYGPPLRQVLPVVVFMAAAIAVAKIGWILAVYFIRG